MMLYVFIFAMFAHFSTAQYGHCPNRNGLVSIIVGYSTNNTRHPVDQYKSQNAVEVCPCQSNNKVYWNPTEFQIPDRVYNESQVAFSLDTIWGPCEQLCICDLNNRCYTNQPNGNAYVDLIPFCDFMGGCFMYAAPYPEVFDNIQYHDLVGENEQIFKGPNGRTDPVGPDSGYIKVKSVSCNGCASIHSVSTC